MDVGVYGGQTRLMVCSVPVIPVWTPKRIMADKSIQLPSDGKWTYSFVIVQPLRETWKSLIGAGL